MTERSATPGQLTSKTELSATQKTYSVIEGLTRVADAMGVNWSWSTIDPFYKFTLRIGIIEPATIVIRGRLQAVIREDQLETIRAVTEFARDNGIPSSGLAQKRYKALLAERCSELTQPSQVA